MPAEEFMRCEGLLSTCGGLTRGFAWRNVDGRAVPMLNHSE
jgi:hypothetical protein